MTAQVALLLSLAAHDVDGFEAILGRLLLEVRRTVRT
jgi:hypothetical protein